MNTVLEEYPNGIQFISYLNASVPSENEECLKCIFFPVCAGGCCVSYKNTPERYALALYENTKKKKAASHD